MTHIIESIARYAKAHVATIFAVGAWATAALKDGHVSGQEWYGLLVAVCGGGAVAAVKNKPKGRAKKAQ